MSKQVAVARINATGALIPLHDANRSLLLNMQGVVETVAEPDPKTGRLTEVDGADHTTMLAATMDLQRIGQALVNNRIQRQTLLTAALKIPNAETYLQQLGVYDGSEDSQYIDPQTLGANNAGLPEPEVSVGGEPVITDVTEQLAAEKAKTQSPKKKPTSKKSKSSEQDSSPDLADL